MEDDTGSPSGSPQRDARTDLERFFVPAIHLLAISGLAFTLIVIVIARSPYTHGNLSSKGYNRTEVAILGQSYQFHGPELVDPGRAASGDAAQNGFFIFLEQGCASCHGLKALGGPVGPELENDYSASQLRREIREPTGGMPSYSETALSDAAIEKILAFITSR